MINAIAITFMFKLVEPLSRLNPLMYQRRTTGGNNDATIRKIEQFLVDSKLYTNSRRAINNANLAKARDLFKTLTKNMTPGEIKKWLRQQPDEATEEPDREEDLRDEQANLVESELKNVLSPKSSALFDHPYVQKKGKNDFLVMRPDVTDPFVTVVPNAIYYNIEKKCVNWLDDCSLQGIRARLLHGVQSPYK